MHPIPLVALIERQHQLHIVLEAAQRRSRPGQTEDVGTHLAGERSETCGLAKELEVADSQRTGPLATQVVGDERSLSDRFEVVGRAPRLEYQAGETQSGRPALELPDRDRVDVPGIDTQSEEQCSRLVVVEGERGDVDVDDPWLEAESGDRFIEVVCSSAQYQRRVGWQMCSDRVEHGLGLRSVDQVEVVDDHDERFATFCNCGADGGNHVISEPRRPR